MDVSNTTSFAVGGSAAAAFHVILLRVKFLSLLLVMLFHWRERKRGGGKLM